VSEPRVEFEMELPISSEMAPTAVAHLVGDEASFRERLRVLMQSGSSDAALLATPIPMGLSGPDTAELWRVLDSVGGAVVRSIVPL
jgi:hypothetical protein